MVPCMQKSPHPHGICRVPALLLPRTLLLPGSFMEFDILAELHTLPTLVVATVFFFLPNDTVSELADSTNSELREYALQRRWRRVAVGQRRWLKSWNVMEYCHWISTQEFNSMVTHNTPPPYYIHYFFYLTARNAEHDSMYMTPEWRKYVATYCRTVRINALVYHGSSVSWTETAPHFHQLNIVSLDVCCHFEQAYAEFQDTALPTTLRSLSIEANRMGEDGMADLVIPESVRYLAIRNLFIHPLHLPVLPRNLKTIQFNVQGGLDMTEYVDLFPSTLQGLWPCHVRKMVWVSSDAILRFSPRLKHSMCVYKGQAPGDISGLTKDSLGWLTVDIGVPGDYTRITRLPKKELHVRCSGMPCDAKGNLMNNGGCLSYLEKIHLHLPLPMDGVVIPEGLEVVVWGHSGGIPPEIWSMSRVIEIKANEAPVSSLPLGLGRMELLRCLQVTLDERVRCTTFPSPPNLESLKMRLLPGSMFPDLLVLARLTRLEIAFKALDYSADQMLLPPNVVDMLFDGIWKSGLIHEKENPVGWRNVDLLRFSLLTKLTLRCICGISMREFIFPDSVVELVINLSPGLVLAEVAFPPRLRRLGMVACGLVDPWTDWGVLFLRRGTRGTIAYPETLTALSIHGRSHALIPPPSDFCFPSNLAELNLESLGISAMAPFRLPRSLRKLDVCRTKLAVLENYQWPRLKHLRISKLLDDGREVYLTAEEREVLEKRIPGVVIEPRND